MVILIVAEKQSQARAILCALASEISPLRNGLGAGRLASGERIEVVAPDGHAYELIAPHEYRAEWKSWEIEHIPIIPPGGIFKRKAKNPSRVSAMAEAASRANEICNCCDAAREGEGIFAEICSELRWLSTAKKITRMWLVSLAASTIRAAFEGRQNWSDPKFQNLAKASRIRQQADWLLGINGSRLATHYIPRVDGVRRAHSVGRVQTPLLGIIYNRSLAVHQFKPQSFYQIFLKFQGVDGTFTAVLKVELKDAFGKNDSAIADQQTAVDLKNKIVRQSLIWTAIDSVSAIEEAPPTAFNLLELQRTCARMFKWSPKRTEEAAQRCYLEYCSITYHRTESEEIPLSQSNEIMRTVYWAWKTLYARESTKAFERHLNFDLSRIVPDERLGFDHHAILPLRQIPPDTDPDARLLWDLIVRRTMVALCRPAIVNACSRVLVCDTGTEQYRAFADEGVVVDPGWLFLEQIIGNCRGRGLMLNERLARRWVSLKDCSARLVGVTLHTGHTSPPDLHNFDTLLLEMKRHNLGTPATRADAIEELFERGYVERLHSAVDVTMQGGAFAAALGRFAPRVISADIAKTWEGELERIQGGKRNAWSEARFIENVITEIQQVRTLLALSNSPGFSVPSCPFSGRPIEDNGSFWVMPGLPKVHFHKRFAGRDMTTAEWIAVATAPKETGAGPFEGFVSGKGVKFTKALGLHPKAKNNKFLRFVDRK